MFTLHFATTNAQFDTDRRDLAIEQILRGGVNLDTRVIANTRCDGNVFDRDGNRIGRWNYQPDNVVDAR